MGMDLVFHLHRLNHQNGLAYFHRIARLFAYTQYRTLVWTGQSRRIVAGDRMVMTSAGGFCPGWCWARCRTRAFQSHREALAVDFDNALAPAGGGPVGGG